MTGAELDLKLCVCFIRLRHWEKEETHGVVAEPGDVAFIAGVEQNGSSRLPPVLVSNKVALLEGAILQEAKVVNLQRREIQTSSVSSTQTRPTE